MTKGLEDTLERAAWYRAKAADSRRIALEATLNIIRESYLDLAKRYDGLADRVEQEQLMKNCDPP